MKLSIITINYNNASGLQKTIESVIKQSFENFEYIVIDGGSTDVSIDIIKQYEKNIPYWVSEKDYGIYHAMNKGIFKASGEYLLMLNSGDYLIDSNVLSAIFANDTSGADVLYANIEWRYKEQYHSNSHLPDVLPEDYFLKKSLAHQSTLIKRSAHAVVGLYDESMKLCADWKFFMLAFNKHKLSFKHVPLTISVGDTEGVSWNSEYFRIADKERLATIKKYFPQNLHLFRQIKKANRYSLKNRLILFKKRILKKITI